MKSLKIAILSYRSAPFGGGQGVYVRDLSDALKKIGHKVTIISGPPYPASSRRYKINRVTWNESL
ncbi:MAG: hypothetical protein ACJ0E6_04770 [Gammaproteobacteria bacterium]